MKKLYFLFCVYVLLIYELNSQEIVFDSQRLIQTILNFGEEMGESVEQTGQIMEQLEKARKSYENWKKVAEALNTVSEYVGKSEDINEMYSLMKKSAEVLSSGQENIKYLKYMSDSEKISYITHLLDLSKYNILLLKDMISKYSPGAKNKGNMDDGTRQLLKMQDMKQAKDNISEMYAVIYEAELIDKDIRRQKEAYFDAMRALGGL